MDGTLGVFGAMIGLAIWGFGGSVAAKAAYETAANEQQRAVLRRLFGIGGLYSAALMGLVLLVGLRLLPMWVYGAAFVLWFGPMLPFLAWLHNRLDETTDDVQGGSPRAAA